MQPGFLHFDLRRALKADMMNAAMSKFLPSEESIRKAFDSLDLKEITWERVCDASSGLKGHVIQFYANKILISSSFTSPKACRRGANRALWDEKNQEHSHNNSLANPDTLGAKNSLIQACLSQERISLEQLKKPFLLPGAGLEIAGLSLEILSNLECDAFVNQKLAGQDALWLLCHLVMHTALLAALDPKFLSASKIYINTPTKSHPRSSNLDLQNETWLRHILKRVPVVEVAEGPELEFDVLAAAFVKSLVGQFGPRGDSVILDMGIGLSRKSKAFIEALWCEASLPDTMSEIGPTNSPRAQHLFEIIGQIPAASADMSALSSSMSLHGAQSLSYYLVQGEKNSMAYLMRFLVSYDRQKEALEAFLIKGNARHAAVKAVECHELNKRLVSVPMGNGNSVDSYRFYEYIYYERCVRVEPLAEDLALYAQKTQYSIDVSRSDLLMAWKKWRGQTVEKLND